VNEGNENPEGTQGNVTTEVTETPVTKTRIAEGDVVYTAHSPNPNGAIAVAQPHGGVLLRRLPDPNLAEKKAALLQAFHETGNMRKAAERIGVSSATPWDWRDSDPEFAAAWQKALLSLEANVAGTLYQRAVSEDVDPRAANVAAMMWGKRHFPEHWSEKHIVVNQAQDEATGILREMRDMLLEARRARERPALPEGEST